MYSGEKSQYKNSRRTIIGEKSQYKNSNFCYGEKSGKNSIALCILEKNLNFKNSSLNVCIHLRWRKSRCKNSNFMTIVCVDGETRKVKTPPISQQI